MNFSEVFIRRPVMTTLVMAAILVFGAIAYRGLPVSDLPPVDFPTITVNANVPGASPETMAATVATPLERQFSTIAGLESMNSTNGQGSTRITLQFTLDRNIDAAAQDVQAMIARTQRQLPREMTSPPSYQKSNPADQPILFIAISSPTLPLPTVFGYADTVVSPRISMVNGVAQVQVYGAQKRAIRVQVDPHELAARGIGIDEVAQAIDRGNANIPTGTLYGAVRTATIRTEGQLTEASGYRDLVVAHRGGAPVRLGDLGRIVDGVENDKSAAWFGDTRAMILAVQRQPGTNTVQVVDDIKAILPALQAQLPAPVKLDILFDRSTSIRESVRDVQFTLLLAIGMVILVIFLFLRKVSATLIPALALPFSIVFTFAVMRLLGYSLDNLSLMALILAVGFVVDDAIVMLENIVRRVEHGEGVVEASLNGSQEIGFTIVSMTLSLVAVFIPVLFMKGIVGRLLEEFAVTISVAILVSGFVSISLTPMLCSRFLRHEKDERHGWFYRATGRVQDAMLAFYGRTLDLVLRHGALTIVVSLVVLAVTVQLFRTIPKGFFPSEDTGRIFANVQARQGIPFEEMTARQRELAEIVSRDPNVESFMSNIGMGSSNAGNLSINLKPRHLRKMSADEVIQSLRKKTAGVVGVNVFFQNPPPINVGGQTSRSQYQFTLQSTDIDELYRSTALLEERLRTDPLLQDLSTDLQLRNPQVDVAIDRERAAALGLTIQQIESALNSAYGTSQVSTVYAPDNQYKVILEVKPEYQADPASLGLLHVRSASSGSLIPLHEVAAVSASVGPQSVNHLGQIPSATVSFNLRPGVSLGAATAAVEQAAREVLPASISTGFQGTAQVFQASTKGLWLLLVMGILVIYLVLGILYESFIHPVTILSGLPSAGFGALVTLVLFKMDLNIYAFVGIIMLVGIVKKNGIMMIDFALEAQSIGKSPREAIHEGCLVRFRPIMMTTMAALVGTLPIALGYGAGGDARRPLGLAVVGGLLVSQVLTLYLTPVLYLAFDRLASLARRPGKAKGA